MIDSEEPPFGPCALGERERDQGRVVSLHAINRLFVVCVRRGAWLLLAAALFFLPLLFFVSRVLFFLCFFCRGYVGVKSRAVVSESKQLVGFAGLG